MIAAEAAVKLGKNADAKTLVNVLRARAGKQTYCVNKRAAQTADYSAEMVAATPATIDIDFILDERSREFWGTVGSTLFAPRSGQSVQQHTVLLVLVIPIRICRPLSVTSLLVIISVRFHRVRLMLWR